MSTHAISRGTLLDYLKTRPTGVLTGNPSRRAIRAICENLAGLPDIITKPHALQIESTVNSIGKQMDATGSYRISESARGYLAELLSAPQSEASDHLNTIDDPNVLQLDDFRGDTEII